MTELRYGDSVKIKNSESRYFNIVGKVIKINSIVALVKFECIKQPVNIMRTCLELI